MKNFYSHTAYRWACGDCGEIHLCAVVRRRGVRHELRLCRACYLRGDWRSPDFDSAEALRHRLAQATRERDHARDLAAALFEQAVR